nr:hypothetical protein Iba_chr09dCG6850 [Ipomoea batatas]
MFEHCPTPEGRYEQNYWLIHHIAWLQPHENVTYLTRLWSLLPRIYLKKRALRPSSRDSNRHVSNEHGNPQMRNLIFVSSS